jgi:hypothetical protein
MEEVRKELVDLRERVLAVEISLGEMHASMGNLKKIGGWIVASSITAVITLVTTGFSLTWRAAQVETRVGQIQETVEKYGDIADLRAKLGHVESELERLRDRVEK